MKIMILSKTDKETPLPECDCKEDDCCEVCCACPSHFCKGCCMPPHNCLCSHYDSEDN